MSYDLEAVRAHFPALQGETAFFDGPGGSQVPDVVGAAVADALTAGMSNRGSVTATERAADETVTAARQAMADLLGADPNGVVFGRSMTALTYQLAAALTRQWAPGDEVIVTRLDHDANIRPWVQHAERAGLTVRWVDPDPGTGELATAAVAAALGPATRLVAVTGASNLIGTRPDVAAIAAEAHSAGALVYLDGVHLTPHAPVSMTELGADFYACSPYKFLGPHLGALVADPALLAEIHPDKLMPSSDAVPERFELGTLPYEQLAGVSAAVDFLAGLTAGSGTRPERLAASMRAVEAHESALYHRAASGLAEIPGVTCHGAPQRRTPTLLFSVVGREPGEVFRALAERGVNAPAGTFYALECARAIGLGDAGAVRAGIAAYTSESDVDRLVEGVAEVTADRPRG